jgi:hypothetical protein
MKSTGQPRDVVKWEFHKKEIYWIYMKGKSTLRTTRSMMQEKHGLMARWVYHHVFKVVHGLTPIYSKRTWKSILRKWGFCKYKTKKLVKAAERTSSRDGKSL